ncbi:protein of unknown function [Bradyrhizobium sp. ORS 285]|uniref:hypothetical protein n=1 Tax=Bradyrhizobium sp. ORS 285 TaxID=115808 RepID=UPI000240958E|nr:hypothetical protein [Bradyrhizobium sp. ORS 285]CCD89842.1 hypothetical protein BRAO285_850044 [Bradyrhizobium sp. ORS 285]SMX61528.1 protein of unknown function [Bradyrhizobium sp. ORS 285]
MALDPVTNFGKVTVSTGYSAADTSVALFSGHGARLPSTGGGQGYNLVWWNSTDYPDPSDDPNVEIVRVTALAADVLTITRAQEGTSASTKNTAGKTYLMALAMTKKMIDDISAAIAAVDYPTEVPATTPDDTTLLYPFSKQPKAVVINGSTFIRTSKIGGTLAWTWDGANAVLQFPVGSGGDIFGIM